MLILKLLRFKNFLAFGNQFTEINFLRNPTTMLVGKSGSGKSTLADALCFAMFGKPFRPVPKGKLVNTVNNKACLVELELDIEGASYLIRRGMKPEVFEIYKVEDGLNSLVNQDSKVRDYQNWLEESVLGMNFKTCIQTVILGYANYTPFMELNAAERRSIVDQILGIDVFTKMGAIVGQRYRQLKIDLQANDRELSTTRAYIESTRQVLSQMETKDKGEVDSIKNECNDLSAQIKQAECEMVILSEKASSLQVDKIALAELNREVAEMRKRLTLAKSDIQRNLDLQQYMKDHQVCITCHQEITQHHKAQICADSVKSNAQIASAAKETHSNLTESLALINAANEKSNELVNVSQQISKFGDKVLHLNKERAKLLERLNSFTDTTATATLAATVLAYVDKVRELEVARNDMLVDQQYYEVQQRMLKDDGIKSTIVNQYIPELNRLINEYLDKMGFHMRFELDSEFNEKILSRFRDSLSYYSLSEGQKSRLSLAITLAWRRLAELRNSSRCNVLILDEVLDANLAASDIESVWGIVEEITKDTNVFVISHRPDALYDRIRSTIQIELRGNFSEIS